MTPWLRTVSYELQNGWLLLRRGLEGPGCWAIEVTPPGGAVGHQLAVADVVEDVVTTAGSTD